jgi:general secretion pathway protein I
MRRGFTLLEVMISLAILAVALVAISDLNGGAVAMHAYSRRATEATLLLRGKMLDVEDDLQKTGFSDFNDEKHGDFTDESAPDYSWSAEILKPDVQLDPSQLLNLLGAGQQGGSKGSPGGGGPVAGLAGAASQLAAAMGGAQGALQGLQGGAAANMLAGPLGGILTSQATTFIETLKKSVREIRLTVSWQEGKEKQEVSASQVVVILPETVGQTPGAPPPPQTAGQGQSPPGTTPPTLQPPIGLPGGVKP